MVFSESGWQREILMYLHKVELTDNDSDCGAGDGE